MDDETDPRLGEYMRDPFRYILISHDEEWSSVEGLMIYDALYHSYHLIDDNSFSRMVTSKLVAAGTPVIGRRRFAEYRGPINEYVTEELIKGVPWSEIQQELLRLPPCPFLRVPRL